MLAPGDHKRVDQPFARDRRPAGTLELGVNEGKVEGCVVDHERRVAKEGDQFVSCFSEKGLVLEEILAQPMNRKGLSGHAALRIEILVERLAGRDAVEQ